jgi:hypothetical protein
MSMTVPWPMLLGFLLKPRVKTITSIIGGRDWQTLGSELVNWMDKVLLNLSDSVIYPEGI